MNSITLTDKRNFTLRPVVTLMLCSPLLFAGCREGATDRKAPAVVEAGDKGAPAVKSAKTSGEEAADESVSLKPEEIEKMGIETTVLVAAKHAPETSGFGVIMSHESIAQGVADLAMAVAVQRQSQAAFNRTKALAGTAGAMPTDTLEAAERQAVVDQAALDLQRRRLTSTYGQHPPWQNTDTSQALTALASGRSQLVRVTFPLGALGNTEPTELRFAHLSGASAANPWKSSSVWSAPADASVPGKSYFALLRGADFGEGERLLAWAAIGEPEDGVTIPAGAAVITNGKYWYYLEAKPGVFVRTELPTAVADEAGYFVKEGASAGDKVVTSAAGQLLARDLNPGKEPD